MFGIPLFIWIVIVMFLAAPFGLILGVILARHILACEEQKETYGTSELIFIKE